MRIVGLTLLLTLPACSINNPLFGVSSETDIGSTGAGEATDGTGAATSSPPGTTNRDPTTTGEPGTTTTLDPTTGAVGDTSGTADATTAPITSTGEASTTGPGTTAQPDTSDSSDQTSTGDPPPMCEPIHKNADLTLTVSKNGVLLVDCPQENGFIKGILHRTGGTLEVLETNECNSGQIGAKYTLGAGYGLQGDKLLGCTQVSITWDPAGETCKLGLLDIVLNNTAKHIYMGAFTLKPPPNFPLQVQEAQLTTCGCPGPMPGCCAPLDVGDLSLTPGAGGPVAPQQTGMVQVLGESYTFCNLQSYIDPECVDDPTLGRHVDWLAEIDLG